MSRHAGIQMASGRRRRPAPRSTARKKASAVRRPRSSSASSGPKRCGRRASAGRPVAVASRRRVTPWSKRTRTFPRSTRSVRRSPASSGDAQPPGAAGRRRRRGGRPAEKAGPEEDRREK